MLRSLKQLYGNKLGASDGEIGHIKDFYFDDQNWAVRYLVVHTDSYLPGRQVLISPYSLGSLDQRDQVVTANLSRKQIEDSPASETHKPVSRQYEEEYFRYFGWPYYWEGSGLWGASARPVLELAVPYPKREASAAAEPGTAKPDTHLRSTQAVNGYHLQATDGILGHVCDFMMDANSWAIGELVVKTGHRFSGKEVLIPTKMMDRISYEDSTVYVNATKAAIERGVGEPAPAGAVPA